MSRRARRRRSRAFERGRITPDPQQGNDLLPQPSMRVMAYTANECLVKEGCSVAELPAIMSAHDVTWVDVAGLGHPDLVRSIAGVFGLHQLAIDDVLHVNQRPKIEPYADSLYVVLRMAEWVEGLETEQVSLFLGRNWVLTFQERPGDCFDPVRERLTGGARSLRSGGADHLAHALIDAVIDSHFPVLEIVGERLEDLEAEVLDRPSREITRAIQSVKRDLLVLRRIAWPTRDAMAALHRDPSVLVGAEARLLLRDCHDHAVQIMDLVETFRELCAGIMELYRSSVSHRMNEIMKVLTIIATLFMPLSFIAGVYGMNFQWHPVDAPSNMPELQWRHGYLMALGIMGATAAGLIGYFFAQGWLSSDRDAPRRDRAAGPEGDSARPS